VAFLFYYCLGNLLFLQEPKGESEIRAVREKGHLDFPRGQSFRAI